MRRLILLTALLAACDLSLEGGPPAGGFLLAPQHACYFKAELDGPTSYVYEFDGILCPGDTFETFGHEHGEYVVTWYAVDGTTVETEVTLDRISVIVGD